MSTTLYAMLHYAIRFYASNARHVSYAMLRYAHAALHYTMLGSAMLRNATHATLCYAMLRCATLCYAVLRYAYAMLRYATLCYAVLRYAAYATLCYAIPRYATLCDAVLHFATLCYPMLCYAVLCCFFVSSAF